MIELYDDKTPWWRYPIWRPLTIWRNLTRDLMNPRLEETLKNHLSPLGKGLFCFHSPLAPLDPPSVPPLPICRPNKPVELTAGEKGGGRGERGELPLLASWRLRSFFCNQSSPTRRWHPTRRQWWSDNIRQNRLFPTKTSNFRLYFRTSNFLSNTHTHFDANVFSLVFSLWHPPLNCWNGHLESWKSQVPIFGGWQYSFEWWNLQARNRSSLQCDDVWQILFEDCFFEELRATFDDRTVCWWQYELWWTLFWWFWDLRDEGLETLLEVDLAMWLSDLALTWRWFSRTPGIDFAF